MSLDPATPPTGLGASLVAGATVVPKAIGKLIDTIGDQIGLLAKPFHTRRQADADTYAAIAKASTDEQIKVMKVGTREIVAEIQERAERRRLNESIRQQQNVEAVAAHAADMLNAGADAVSDTPVDPDWVTEFLGHCQNVSNEQMQTLWGKLLAGEVAKPGSFSLRTLSMVKTLARADAELFTKFCGFAWSRLGGSRVPIVPWLAAAELQAVEFAYTGILRLVEIGLIHAETLTGYTLTMEKVPVALSYFGRRHLFMFNQDKLEMPVGHVIFTEVGQELASVVAATPNETYLARAVESLSQKGWFLIHRDPNTSVEGSGSTFSETITDTTLPPTVDSITSDAPQIPPGSFP